MTAKLLLASSTELLTPEFVLQLSALFLEFVYTKIERGRRWGIWNMSEACPPVICKTILRNCGGVFSPISRSPEYAERLESSLRDESGGLDEAAWAIEETNSPEKAEELRGRRRGFSNPILIIRLSGSSVPAAATLPLHSWEYESSAGASASRRQDIARTVQDR